MEKPEKLSTMSINVPSDVIQSCARVILDLLNDSHSSDSDDSEEDGSWHGKHKSDLTTDVLIYASTLSSYRDCSDDSDDSESFIEYEVSNCAASLEVTQEIPVAKIEDNQFESLRYVEETFEFPGLPELKSLTTISEMDFKTHFGVNKSTLELLRFLMPEKSALGRPQINDTVFLLVSLWYMVTSEPHNAIAERFKLGKANSYRCVVDFCTMLTDHSQEFVTWPDRNDAMATIDTFKNNYDFPGVMGVLSNSHMTIKCPAFDALNYCNVFGKYSVYLQTVVLPSLHFSYVFAGWPGSSTDEEVLLKSPLYPRLVREPSSFVPDASHILTKGPFTLQTFLLTPYRDNGYLSPAQQAYNLKHSQVCVVADYALGLLKNRFTRLTRLEVLKMDLLTKIIVASCVLHNICLEEGDSFRDFVAESSAETHLDFEMATTEAELKRDTIANSFVLSQV